MDLDGDTFANTYSSVMRVRARDMKWEMNLRMATTHPGKKGKFNLKPLEEALDPWLPTAELKSQMKSATDLSNTLNKRRAPKKRT